ncbi:MAG: hypothetical protein ABEK10_03795 [Candidatus Nanosalina sp.]
MRILYVCTGNSHRSPVAEALTRKYHPELEVESAGTSAVGSISEIAHQEVQGEGAENFLKPEPDQLTVRAVEEADRIVCMMPRHRGYLERNYDVEDKDVEVWDIEDPVNPGINSQKVFREINKNVRKLGF